MRHESFTRFHSNSLKMLVVLEKNLAKILAFILSEFQVNPPHCYRDISGETRVDRYSFFVAEADSDMKELKILILIYRLINTFLQ